MDSLSVPGHRFICAPVSESNESKIAPHEASLMLTDLLGKPINIAPHFEAHHYIITTAQHCRFPQLPGALSLLRSNDIAVLNVTLDAIICEVGFQRRPH